LENTVSRKPKNQVINNINLTVNGDVAASRSADNTDSPESTRRKKLRKKTNDKKNLGSAAAEDIVDKPHDLDLQKVTCYPANCIANTLVNAEWSQMPIVRFSRKTKDVYFSGNDYFSGKAYLDCLRFNDWTFRRLGLKLGMKLALFTDRVKVPRYLIVQNVVRCYEAPAHLHRLGTFTLRRGGGGMNFGDHVCKPRTRTRLGVIGHTKFEKYPLSLFEHLPYISDHQMRLYRMSGAPDVIIGFFSELKEVPNDIADKLLLPKTGLLESDHRPYNPNTDIMDMAGFQERVN
jgi:hypothetical protein